MGIKWASQALCSCFIAVVPPAFLSNTSETAVPQLVQHHPRISSRAIAKTPKSLNFIKNYKNNFHETTLDALYSAACTVSFSEHNCKSVNHFLNSFNLFLLVWCPPPPASLTILFTDLSLLMTEKQFFKSPQRVNECLHRNGNSSLLWERMLSANLWRGSWSSKWKRGLVCVQWQRVFTYYLTIN